jgi:cell division septation protein DedD
MFRWGIFAGAFASCVASMAVAQTTRPTDPVFARAQALVSDGNGVAGRALIDSVLAATQPGARLYPEALFWRASLAANAADAESDYKHLVVDYPLAPQAEDALLRLAQLELARGDRDGALAHLQRIPRDYPRSKSLARASYWTARVLFEKNDIANACVANANAQARAAADEIELRNQIQYQGQRCPAGAAAVASAKPPTIDSTIGTPTPAPAATVTPPTLSAPGSAGNNAANVVKTADSAPPKSVPATVVTAPTASAGSTYSVQVAAYNHKADASKLVSSLVQRGYAARVDGNTAPFRVRIGRYSTAQEAEKALAKIKAKHMTGFVTRAPER